MIFYFFLLFIIKICNMENSKSKSIIIDGTLHNEFKNFCRGKNLKIGGVVEKLVKGYINNYYEINKLIEKK